MKKALIKNTGVCMAAKKIETSCAIEHNALLLYILHVLQFDVHLYKFITNIIG